MKRSLITIFWFTAMSVARAVDFATTRYFTPDLTQEANPLVSILGGHWGTLIITNVVVYIAVGACAFMYSKAKPRCDLLPEAKSVWDFASLLLYGEKLSKGSFLRKRLLGLHLPPKGSRISTIVLFGFTLPPLVTFGSLIAVFMWFATRLWKFQWVISVHSQLGIFLLIIPVLVLWAGLEYLYFSREYRQAKEAIIRD